MGTSGIKDLPNGAPTDLGGDGSFGLTSKFLIEDTSGNQRHIDLQDILGFLGINVGTQSTIQAVNNNADQVGFITDGRKTNYVEGTTFAEGAGLGTGVLCLWTSSSNPESIGDGAAVTT